MDLALIIMPTRWKCNKSTSILDVFLILYNKLERHFAYNYLYEDKPQE